jgi:hypothetical protein
LAIVALAVGLSAAAFSYSELNVGSYGLAVGGRSASSSFRFSVMAAPGLGSGDDSAIHGNDGYAINELITLYKLEQIQKYR